jgi:acyl transferase domain-containing protein
MFKPEGNMKASPTSKSNDTQTPIAVIGMACRLPGNCNNPTDFWNFLLDGGIASTDVPQTRFSHAGHYDGSLRPGTMRSTGGMMLNIDPKDLDAGFFALSQVDAISMDPSQRQLLEVVYEGLENSGLTLENIKRKSYGCFVGSYASGKVFCPVAYRRG